MNTQTHPPYAIPETNQFQISQTKEIPQASVQHPSLSTQIPSSELANLTIHDNDKGKSLQLLNDSNSFVLVRDISQEVILGTPFLTQIYPFKVDQIGVHTQIMGIIISFKFVTSIYQNDLSLL